MKKVLLFLFFGMSLAGFSQQATFDNLKARNVFQPPAYSSLAAANMAGMRAGNLVNIYAGADSGLWKRSWDNGDWVKMNSSGGGGSGWGLTGTAATNPTTNFLGTSDNQDFSIRRNNVERLRFFSDRMQSGNISINGTTGYLNFNGTNGFSGVGLRFSGGKVQAKNGTGSWFDLESVQVSDFNMRATTSVDYPTGGSTFLFNVGIGDLLRDTYSDNSFNAENTLVGYSVGYSGGSFTTVSAYGYGSVGFSTDLNNIVAIGKNSGRDLVSNTNSTFLGSAVTAQSGMTNNIAIGHGVSTTGNNSLNIGGAIFATGLLAASNTPSLLASSIARVGVGVVVPHESSKLELAGTNGGLLLNRVSTAQRNAIANPQNGLVIFCTDCAATTPSVTGVTQTYAQGAWRNHF